MQGRCSAVLQGSLAVAVPVKSTREPMHLVVDSTGLNVCGEGEWKVRKHGWTTRRTWRELHLGVNADTVVSTLKCTMMFQDLSG
ncbi:MAG: hypothetical protein HOA27_05570 [Gemmatimonadetes bacterium]|nr:hypothetical protein [Gemmatimonadota bacterium]MBT5453182.1 hypothetical protein [Gemmatimonadota bacterium]MBT6903625.1 hypothetical protein [Gemmatimonadota bacterium]